MLGRGGREGHVDGVRVGGVFDGDVLAGIEVDNPDRRTVGGDSAGQAQGAGADTGDNLDGGDGRFAAPEGGELVTEGVELQGWDRGRVGG